MPSVRLRTCPKCGTEHESDRARCRECRKAYHRDYDQNRRHRKGKQNWNRSSQLKHRYGITAEDYDAMLDAQGGACACCGQIAELTVDHDHGCTHAPGERCCAMCVRGLLCNRCNRMLGQAQDDPNLLIAGALYLMERNDDALRRVPSTK